MNNILFLLTFVTSLSTFANFTNLSGNVDFGSNLNTKEILFKNEGSATASLQIQIEDQSKFSIALNRCNNVAPQRQCQLTVRFNKRGLSGTAEGVLYNSLLNYNSGSLNLTGSVVVAPPSQPVTSISVDLSTLIFEVASENERRSVAKTLTIRNNGSALSPSISVTNGNNFKILINRCNQSIPKDKSCSISLAYEPKGSSLETNGSINIQGTVVSLVGKKVGAVVLAPVGDNSTLNSEVEVTRSLSQQVSVTQGSGISWSLTGSYPAGTSISSTGLITLNPTISQVGSYNFNAVAQNQYGSFIKPIILKVKPYLDFPAISVNEGAIGNNLFYLRIKSGVYVNKVVSSNMNQLVTIVSVKKNGGELDNFTRLAGDSTGNTIEVGESSFGEDYIDLSIGGGIRYSSVAPLLLTIHTSNGNFNYSVPFTINSLGLPYLNYDIFAVRGSDEFITGDNTDQIIINMDVFQQVSVGWRTPIITKYRVQQINCNGSFIDDYYGDNTDHQNCVSARASTNSETAFFFQYTYSAANVRIGGRAQGIKHGVVIESSPWFYTLAHEIGHNLGLFHTFESAGNSLVIHNDGGLTQRTVYKDFSPLRASGNYSGDWLNYIFDFNSSFGVVPFNYGVTNDTAIDYYSAKKKTLSNPTETGSFFPNNPFRNGDQLYLGYTGQTDFSGRTNGFACQLSSYNSGTKVWTTACDAGITLDQGTINNVMSYWYKNKDGNTLFTSGQKSRIDAVINFSGNQYLGVRP